jgi:membrane protein DedA with SNARE-associated domain
MAWVFLWISLGYSLGKSLGKTMPSLAQMRRVIMG